MFKAFEKSDYHRPIKIKFNIKYPTTNYAINKTTNLFNYYKANQKKFDLELQRIVENIDEVNIEEQANKIHQAISSAAKKSTPKKNNPLTKSNYPTSSWTL